MTPGVLVEDGLLLPVRPPGRLVLAGLALGAVFLLGVSGALVGRAVATGHWLDLLAAPVTLAGAVLFAAAGLALARQDSRGRTGLLLTPTGVRLTDREHPVTLAWEAIRAVEDSSPLVPEAGEDHPAWITFVLTGEPEPDLADELRLLSGSPYPSLDGDGLVAGHDAARELCRFYLQRPELRAELGTPAALERLTR